MLNVGKLVVQQVEIPIKPACPSSAPAPPLTHVLAPVPAEVCCSSLLFLQDILSDIEFSVDSGASVSVFPGPKSASIDRVCILIADRSPMVSSGSWIIHLRFSCCSRYKVYSWNFQIALVSVPLLGGDFLQVEDLLVDIKGRRVVLVDCPESVILRASPGSQPAFCSVAFLSAPQRGTKFLEDFPDVLSSDGFTALKPLHGVRHHLLTNPGPPVFAKPWKLLHPRMSSPPWRKQGLASPWSSPLHMVKKKDGGRRLCGDYKRLNNFTVPDRYPLPHIANFISQIAGSTVFSRLNLQKGYYQIPIASEDVPKTVIITPFGMFEFLHLPFDLRNKLWIRS